MHDSLKSQTVFLTTMAQAMRQNRFSHAILLKGASLDVQKEAALYLAQSLICVEEEMACGRCNDCTRIMSGDYTDLIFIDGSNQAIKKQDIEQLQNQFAYSALEMAGKKIYIIHVIENATTESLNSLLKFLEEPDGETYAILTTNNIEKVLPTILSRCQLVSLKSDSVTNKVTNLIEKGVSDDDAYIISHLFDDYQKAIEMIESERYKAIKHIAYQTLEKLGNQETPHVLVQIELMKNFSEQDDLQLFLRIVYYGLKESVFKEPRYFKCIGKIITKLSTQKDLDKKMMLVLDYESKLLNTNMNTSLLMDQLLFRMNGGDRYEHIWR